MDINYLYDKMERSRQLEMPVFTDFLDYGELIEYRSTLKVAADCFTMELKGFKDDERRMVGFFPVSYKSYMSDDELKACFPVKMLKITSGFGEGLNHRDILGAVLGLGLERKLFGDLIVEGDTGYMLCNEVGATVIIRELIQAGRVNVSVSVVSFSETFELEPKWTLIKTTVASLRLDGVVKNLGGISRSTAVTMINNGFVKVNQKEVTKTHYQVKENDILSVRKKGKFKIDSLGEPTKKGRIPIVIKKYV